MKNILKGVKEEFKKFWSMKMEFLLIILLLSVGAGCVFGSIPVWLFGFTFGSVKALLCDGILCIIFFPFMVAILRDIGPFPPEYDRFEKF